MSKEVQEAKEVCRNYVAGTPIKNINVSDKNKLKNAIEILVSELDFAEQCRDAYLEKLMFALRPTDHMLDDVTKAKFKEIISENLDLETAKIREKLKIWWECGKYE